jgi:hypothetical protein
MRVFGSATREAALPSAEAMYVLPPADDRPLAAAAWEKSLAGYWGYGAYVYAGYPYYRPRPLYLAPYRYYSYYRPWYSYAPAYYRYHFPALYQRYPSPPAWESPPLDELPPPASGLHYW